MTATVGEYVVTPADLGADRSEIVRLWAENFGLDQPERRYDWLYATGLTRGWLLRTADGLGVGAAALSHRSFRLNGEIVRGTQAIDFVVDGAHRTLGPAIQLQQSVTAALVDERVPVAYALPNRKSEGVLIRSGYRKIGALQRWAKVLRYEDVIERRLAIPFAGVAGRAVSAAAGVVARDRWVRVPDGTRMESVTAFDSRFDDLWQRSAGQFHLVGERNADYLQWRFSAHPAREYSTVAMVGADDRLLGYVVHYEDADAIRVADTLAIDYPTWKTLLAAFVRQVRGTSAAVVSLLHFGSAEFETMLDELGFQPRAMDSSVLVFKGSANAASEAHRWFATEADRDV
jgi:hypothetical protein